MSLVHQSIRRSLAHHTPAPIDLSMGDAFYPPPSTAEDAAIAAIRSQRYGYAPPGGLQPLRQLLAVRLSRSTQRRIDTSQILITSGASLALYSALAALLHPGEAVMCPDPGYPHYAGLTRTLGGNPVRYCLRHGSRFEQSVEALAEACPASARIVIWNSPSNPTGAVASQEVVCRLVAFAEERALWIICDEVYAELAFDRPHCSPFSVEQTDRVLTLSSFSKNFGLSGWRVGYLVMPPRLYRAAQNAHWTAAMTPSTVSQYAALGALHAPDSYLQSLRHALRTRRDAALEVLTPFGLSAAPAHGAMYLWIDIKPTCLTAQQFCDLCREAARVGLTPGHVFGPSGEGYVRLCFAVSQHTLIEGARRVGELYRSLTRNGDQSPGALESCSVTFCPRGEPSATSMRGDISQGK